MSKFEADLDFANKTMRFHPRGSIVSGALDVESLVEVPLAMHPTGLKTVACRLNASDAFPGVLDMGSFFSVVNWMALGVMWRDPSPCLDPNYHFHVGLFFRTAEQSADSA